MLKIIAVKGDTPNLITMSEMKPLQIGKLVDNDALGNIGCIVMRTASKNNFEVMNLTIPEPNKCWNSPNALLVELLGKGHSIQIELFNESE